MGGILAAGLQHTVPGYFPLAHILVLLLGSLCVALPLCGVWAPQGMKTGGMGVDRSLKKSCLGDWTHSKSESHHEIKINVRQKCNENDTLFPRVRLNW